MTINYSKNAEGLFVCTHKGCNKTCSRQNTMYYHLMRHRNEFSYKCEACDKGFIQKSAFLHHMAAIHPGSDTVNIKVNEVNRNTDEDPTVITETSIRIKNPYEGQNFTCPCCQNTTRTKANALVHYARLHAKDWIPAYNKDNGCPHCNKMFASIAAYLYHCTGCIPTNNNHRDMISRMIDNE